MNILWFILGTILGSFYLVVATRLPKGEDVVKSRSKCDSCGKVLKWYNLIPLVSFIVQGGKCSKQLYKIMVNTNTFFIKKVLVLTIFL